MDWNIKDSSQKDYDVARAHVNKGEDTCAFTVGMLVQIIFNANEQIGNLQREINALRSVH